MRALILVAGACLAVAACGDPAPGENAGDGNAVTVETVPDDGNWVEMNTDEGNVAERCAADRKCPAVPDPD